MEAAAPSVEGKGPSTFHLFTDFALVLTICLCSLSIFCTHTHQRTTANTHSRTHRRTLDAHLTHTHSSDITLMDSKAFEVCSSSHWTLLAQRTNLDL